MHYIIIGLGATGFSVLNYLLKTLKISREKISVWDTRETPPQARKFYAEYQAIACQFGGLEAQDLLQLGFEPENTCLVLSPGLSLKLPWIQRARVQGFKMNSDVELFLQELKQSRNQSTKIIGITGSNGKSTVTVLTGFLLEAQGHAVVVGGNIGRPVLDLLEKTADLKIDYCVLELSSFQLELLADFDLKLDVACFLNISADHLDRHETLESYYAAKHIIYKGAKHLVYNAQDAYLLKHLPCGLQPSAYHPFGAKAELKVSNAGFSLLGHHNQLNLEASVSILKALGLEFSDQMQKALGNFKGLEHRAEKVRIWQNILFVNDSKATNVGATLAALEGLRDEIKGQWVLILGGDAKGADLRDLKPAILKNVKACILIGKDAFRFLELLEGELPCIQVSSMVEVVSKALEQAQPGDGVLLAPACASTDMFRNFEDRGQQFKKQVLAIF
ncbi:MAG: UDP-N-acetylmuramoyl-L-alanine--D-glutamate ligase [Gammaproteobacteria bacterium]